jgi:hypothetical protein
VAEIQGEEVEMLVVAVMILEEAAEMMVEAVVILEEAAEMTVEVATNLEEVLVILEVVAKSQLVQLVVKCEEELMIQLKATMVVVQRVLVEVKTLVEHISIHSPIYFGSSSFMEQR